MIDVDGLRRYCWRTGGVVVLEDGVRCPECGSLHDPLPDQSRCGVFVAHEDHGHPCDRPAGHAGAHANSPTEGEGEGPGKWRNE
jgi:hypothetical protein